MPNELHKRLNSLVASIGFNDGANKGFWRVQPREKFGEDAGQWIEMGAELRMFFKNKRGETASVTGRAVGSTGTPDGVRVLIQGKDSEGVADGIYGANTANVRIADAIIPDEVLKKQGIENKPQISKEQEATLPTLDQLERADITDEDIRLINEGIDAPEAKEQASYRKSVEAEEAKGADATETEQPAEPIEDLLVSRDPIAEVIADIAYNGDTEETLDALIQKIEADSDIKKVKGFSLDRGNVIRANDGNDYTIEDIDFEAKTMKLLTADGRPVTRPMQDPRDPSKQVPTRLFPIDPKKEYSVVKGKKGLPKPAKPAPKAEIPTAPETNAPEATPNAPAAPETPEVPEVPAAEAPATPAKPQKIGAAKRRADDGKTIKRQEFTPEELEALRKTKLDPLVNENGESALETDAKGKVRQPRDPNAMLNFLADTYKNSKFNDRGQLVLMRETSSENGKNIEWEIRAAITGEKKIAYMFHFKDLDTGEEQTLLHKDARDSVQSLIGKTNGPEVLADILTGKETRKYSPTFDTAVHANDVLERSLYFKYQGRTKTITESAKYYSTGYAQRINPVNGTLLEQEVPSTFEAYQNKDREALEARLRAVFGRLPVDEQTHEEARTAIRELFAERFPEEDKRSFGMAVTMASKAVQQNLLDTPENRAVPWSSKDKVTSLEVGQVVEYENNIKEKSIVRVIGKQKVNTASPAQSDDIFDYGDYVTVIDANGKRTSLPSTSLAILKDQKTELTTYKGRVSGARLREERGVFYTPGTLRFPGQTTIPDRISKVDDLVPGDNFYSKDGSNLGVVVESVPIVGKDGKKGFGVLYINKDGEVKKAAIASGEQRGPKLITSNVEAAKPTKQIVADTDESDPDFDLDAIEFETDPNTIERPKTVGLDFNVPVNSKRNAEQQLALNEEVQNEIDELASDLKDKFPNWEFDASSLNATSYFNAGELSKLMEAARLEYPDLTDSEIRTLLELKHSKQRGFFGMTKQQMIAEILKEPAKYKKTDGAIRDVSVDLEIGPNGKLIPAFPESELTDYFGTIQSIDKFLTDQGIADSFGTMDHGIRLVSKESKFSALYRSAGGIAPRGVLGVNIALPKIDGSFSTTILVNGEALRGGGLTEDAFFGTPFTHVIAHEFGHTIQNFINIFGFKTNPRYAKVAAEKITRYGESSYGEHFAESFSKFLQTGEASEVFKDFLVESGILSSSNVEEVEKKAKD
jgi:hypothetical protein